MDEIQKVEANVSVIESLTNAIYAVEETDVPNKYDAIIKMVDKIVEVTEKMKPL